ncbi:hypothetical protein FRB90_004298 [Tulasnella sp. 427]|nr:hypothetical protein FRB90_004298 [Tulasnella sp. 427]
MAAHPLSDLVLKRLAEEVVARALDSNINDLESALREAALSRNSKSHVEALELVSCHINQYRNLLLPVSRLPNEILLDILHRAANTEWISTFGEGTEQAFDIPDDKHVRSIYRAVFKLQSVCREWHDLVESDPRFWAGLSPEMAGPPLEKALYNSANSKLVVLGQRGRNDVYPEQMLRQLESRSDRFHSLVLTKRWHKRVPFQAWRKPLPKLAKLWLVNFEDDTPVDQAEYFGGQPPPLRFLSALDSPLPPHPPMYKALECLSVCGALKFGRAILQDVLPNCPRLRILYLKMIRGHDGSMSDALDIEGVPATIELPQLEVMSLRFCAPDFTLAVLSHVVMPQYKTLEVLTRDIIFDPLASALTPFIHNALRTTDRPVALDLTDIMYEFRTKDKTILLSRGLSNNREWPDFFAGYQPSTDSQIIRVALFLGTSNPAETPDPGSVSSFNTGNFILV